MVCNIWFLKSNLEFSHIYNIFIFSKPDSINTSLIGYESVFFCSVISYIYFILLIIDLGVGGQRCSLFFPGV